MEIWKDIKGYEGYYQVSNLGRLKTLERMVNCSGGSTRKINERIIFGSNGKYLRYQQVHLRVAGRINNLSLVHRLVAQTFVSNPDNKPHVNHINGIKMDNRAENLEWCTMEENMQHAFRTGLKDNFGENHSQSFLTKQQVLEIRALKGILTQQKIGEMYGTARTTISSILNRYSWNHI